MKNKKEEIEFVMKKGKVVGYRDIHIAGMKNRPVQPIQKAIKTRIRKDYDSVYENTPSREIKKWFELRKFNFPN
jgi:hypothetical protein